MLRAGFELSLSEASTLRKYVEQGNGRRQMNNRALGYYLRGELDRHLRRDRPGSPPMLKNSSNYLDMNMVKDFAEIFRRSVPLPKGTILYRGEVLTQKSQVPRAGDTFQNLGAISTSLDPAIAKEFSTPKAEHPEYSDDLIRVVKIIKPDPTVKSIPVMLAAWIHNWITGPALHPILMREEEILLHPQTQFTVKKVREKSDDQGVFYEVTLTASGPSER